jgi:hypothetical protein
LSRERIIRQITVVLRCSSHKAGVSDSATDAAQ